MCYVDTCCRFSSGSPYRLLDCEADNFIGGGSAYIALRVVCWTWLSTWTRRRRHLRTRSVQSSRGAQVSPAEGRESSRGAQVSPAEGRESSSGAQVGPGRDESPAAELRSARGGTVVRQGSLTTSRRCCSAGRHERL